VENVDVLRKLDPRRLLKRLPRKDPRKLWLVENAALRKDPRKVLRKVLRRDLARVPRKPK
jgi:hypothetical protein